MNPTGLDATLAVNEMFGPTVQGEGPSAGRRALFLRLTGCHLSCSWCDTPFTWDRARYDLDAETIALTVDEVLAWLGGETVELVVVTGGEPLLQQTPLTSLLHRFRNEGYGGRIEVETSGTVSPQPGLVPLVTTFNVSPKLANSGLPARRRLRPAALRQLAATGRCVWKFVARDLGDLDEVADLVREFSLDPVWVMPEGRTASAVLAGTRTLADPVVARGWNLTTRLHVLAWGDERGR